MCGICGEFAYGRLRPVSKDQLIAMQISLTHRGPDASGLWIDPSLSLGFAHSRLSMLDLNAASKQPMLDVDGVVAVVFNGEIYNHHELRRELLQMGYRFHTDHSDTEVLVNGYKAWGWDELLRRLRGMFAIALWDIQKHHLYLARDRIGIKPLYLHLTSGRVLFASEIKAILQVTDVPRVVDPIALYHYLSGMVAPAPMTMFQGIQKLPAGCYVRILDDGQIMFKRYWHPMMEASQHPSFSSRESAVEYVRTAFNTSVTEHMAADVPVGILLSGGVDSTALLATMSAQANGSVHTFSVGYEGHPEIDERQQAREIAQHFGAQHHEVVVTQRCLEDSWNDIIYHQDEPLADWVCFPLFHVAKLAAKEVKAVMVGEGADELFAGYDGYLRYLRLHKQLWSPYSRYIPSSVRKVMAHLAEYTGRAHWRKSAALDFLIRASRDQECFWGGAATFWEMQKNALLHKNAMAQDALIAYETMLDDRFLRVLNTNTVMVAAAELMPEASDSQLTRMINLEFAYRLPELLLMRVDKMTMAHSLEARVPFLDHRLVASVFDLPTEWKIQGGCPKSLFKDAVRGLIPDAVINRAKVGFGAPVSLWLKGDFGHCVERDILLCPLFRSGWFNVTYIKRMFQAHRSSKGDFSTNLWALYNLASWYSRWIDAPNVFASRMVA